MRLDAFDANVRYMIPRDLAEVLLMEATAARRPRLAQFYHAAQAWSDATCLVVERWGNQELLGVMLYHKFADRIRLSWLCVSPWYQRRGLGRAMFKVLRRKLDRDRRLIDCPVPEGDVAMQLFLQAVGCECWSVMPARDREEGDVYHFRYRLKPRSQDGGFGVEGQIPNGTAASPAGFLPFSCPDP